MYRLEFRPAAIRALRQLDAVSASRVRGAIALLASEPRPPGSRKLSGRDAYRVRVGDYRIIYTIDDPKRIVVVVLIGHRKDVYR
ncbi:MAG TPA: type II toxin-antitoxin system RelE/ParE family toxin [Trueperaceae bacterium]|nr:type II toxin-antitoxin system RelE/ParE family toxin [Trueperaceae bacterium]